MREIKSCGGCIAYSYSNPKAIRDYSLLSCILNHEVEILQKENQIIGNWQNSMQVAYHKPKGKCPKPRTLRALTKIYKKIQR